MTRSTTGDISGGQLATDRLAKELCEGYGIDWRPLANEFQRAWIETIHEYFPPAPSSPDDGWTPFDPGARQLPDGTWTGAASPDDREGRV